ncbi:MULTISPECIES: hypothetical protein [Polymorphospora]|uniref:Uncharacterized protein n=1 Tax=Polymorphospora lycopeni TaxID=3140240 RepID=A0ABV5CRI7_9ACTN
MLSVGDRTSRRTAGTSEVEHDRIMRPTHPGQQPLQVVDNPSGNHTISYEYVPNGALSITKLSLVPIDPLP